MDLCHLALCSIIATLIPHPSCRHLRSIGIGSSSSSISYDRVLDTCTTIGNHVCDHYHRSQVVCSSKLCEGLSLQQPLIMTIRQQQLQMLCMEQEYDYSSIPAVVGMSSGNTTFWQRNQHLRICQTFHSPTLLYVL